MTGPRYWRSLNELADSPQFRDWLHREFPEQASELDTPSRRTMFKLMAASFGLAGLAACRRPEEKILPASKGVEDYIPGNPLYYHTVMPFAGSATGLMVECHDGRPTKVEGNRQHPLSGGASTAFAQAEVLHLYDPDRSRDVLRGGRKASWEEFFEAAGGIGQKGAVRFLSGRVVSPSLEAVKAHALAKWPGAKWIEYEPVWDANAVAGAQLAFGQALRPRYRLEKADVILALDADFLGLDAAAVSDIRDFSRRRKVEHSGHGKAGMNRLYAVEGQFSITGAMADHRLRMRVGEIEDFAQEVAAQLALPVMNGSPDVRQKWLRAVARDLAAHKGRSLVVAGPRQPAEVHALAYWMNQQLGNTGETVTFVPAPAGGVEALKELAGEMARGEVGALVILGGNPAYDAPADLDFAANLKRVPLTVHLGLDVNETAALAAWHLPEAHVFESWGDARALDGTVSIQQPLIEPLHGGRSAAEVVARISDYKDQRAYDIVRNYWLSQWPLAGREAAWRKALHDGVVANAPKTPEVKPALKWAPSRKARPAAEGIEVAFYPSASVWDGRYANNGWLQEAPDPMTKLVWDNAALVSPATARSLGLATGDMLEIEAGGRKIAVPAMVQPGQADNSVALALGYGRESCGRVGRKVGHNVYPLRTSNALWFTSGARVRKTGRRYQLATTQEHHAMEGRPIVREGSLAQYEKDPGFAHKTGGHHPKLFSIYGEHSYDTGNQWGMAVDLNQCIGCNACLVACQAENNIPIVGKDQVARGREMHWIRLDRYFTGSPDDPQAVTQPVACMQCENAPCETVCPVAATVHSPEGLNDMAYNRCVGTRYCANNCPYKVRRFNFLNFHKDLEEVQKMVHNPDVTVRMRGVMEKCTYCVQRIQEVKIKAKAEGRRPIADGEIQTACQQACPAEAIVFGNINDPNSRVAKLRQDHRNYALLEELNVKPRTTYLAKLRNPNPELA